MKTYKTLLWFQALYYLFTAVWPIADRESFEAVTGEKCDFWLVITVSSILIPLSLCLLSLGWHKAFYPAFLLGAGSALGLMFVDLYYGLRGVIGPAYLADAVPEGIVIILWVFTWFKFKKEDARRSVVSNS